VVQRSDFRRKKLIEEYAVLPISHGDGQAIEQSCKVLICHFEHTVPQFSSRPLYNNLLPPL
jgi:hypothetical protein